MDKRSAIVLIIVGVLLLIPSAYAALTIATTNSWAVALTIVAIALFATPMAALGLIAWGVVRLIRKTPDP